MRYLFFLLLKGICIAVMTDEILQKGLTYQKEQSIIQRKFILQCFKAKKKMHYENNRLNVLQADLLP